MGSIPRNESVMAFTGAAEKQKPSVTLRPSAILWLGALLLVLGATFLLPPRPREPVPAPRLAAVPPPVRLARVPHAPSAFAAEASMSDAALMARWEPMIALAARKFAIPAAWIRDVMRAESGGRTMLGEGQPIVSDMGAEGLMQLLPQTYADMAAQYGLGKDVFDPQNNIFAGAAYLKWLKAKYGFPGMFAAYNDGPGLFEAHLFHGRPLPDETRAYVAGITRSLGQGGEWLAGTDNLTVTRPDGAKVALPRASIKSVRAALPGEYAPGVLAVVDMGTSRQGVLESPAMVEAALSGVRPRPKRRA